MRSLSIASIIESHKLATDSAWIFLLEIGLNPIIYLTGNNESVVWNGKTWIPFPFEMSTVGESGKGEIPSISVKVSNATGEIQRRLELADGAGGTSVKLFVINTETSLANVAELELNFILDHTKYDDEWVYFQLTGANCLTRRVPRRRYLANTCQFTYGGVECGIVAAPGSECNKTYARCTELDNSQRFGGFPWMPKN